MGSPYIDTYVHETIPLAKKDLPAVDRHTLPFSRNSPERVRVDSILIDRSKAITTHSHLTERGVELLHRFKRMPRWQPAIGYCAGRLVANAEKIPIAAETYVLLFENEVLCLEKNAGKFRIFHFSLWQRQFPDRRIEAVKALLEGSREKARYTYVDIAGRETGKCVPQHFSIQKLLAAPGLRKVESVSFVYKKNKLRFLKRLSPRYVLAFTLVCSIVCAAAFGMRLSQLKSRRYALSKSIEALAAETVQIEPVIRGEREYYRLSSMMEAISQFRFDPSKFLERMDSILPKTVWIHSVSIDDRKITLNLLDRGPSDMALLMERLSMHLGRPSLESNEEAMLQGRKVKRYQFTLDELTYDPDRKLAE